MRPDVDPHSHSIGVEQRSDLDEEDKTGTDQVG